MRDGLLALVLLAATATTALGAERAPPRDVDELQARVAEILTRNGVPGVGLALLTRDRVLWSGGVGLADRPSP